MALGDGQEPIFVFDSREEFMPVAVDSVEALDAEIINPDDTDGGKVALDDLPGGGGWINLPPDPRRYEGQMEEQFGKVGYRRAVDGGGLSWVQYWLWYLYNPKKVVVTGNHEGDWEFVQVGYAGGQPVCMTTSQHHSGGARMWWEVEVENGRPIVYVALGSHANYFKPVDQLPEIGDDGDGAGARLDAIQWREFGSWAAWPGQWGNSRGQGHSPDSPGSQGNRWKRPHLYHSEAHHQP
jgi:Vacuolar protein sorting-associated protein 62